MSEVSVGALGPIEASPARTVTALRRLRLVSLKNTIVGKLAKSRLRLILVAIFSLVFWGGLFWLFMDGFRFLDRHRMISGPLVEMLFGLYFGSLLIMLLFSSGIILYAGLFASDESRSLLVRPIPTDQIFAFKFQEAMFFSCWGFILLGSPMMIAYGLNAEAPVIFYPMALIFFISFAFVPGSMGAMACLLITSFLPRRRREFVIALIIAVGLGVVAAGARLWSATRGSVLSSEWLAEVIDQLRFSNFPIMPNRWISKGMLAATYPGGIADAAFYLLVLLSNALFLYLLTATAYRYLYRYAYNRVHSFNFSRGGRASNLLPRLVDKLFFPLSGPIRVLILKDIRTFMRDPVQWLQVLIFSGLLAFYFYNLGRMNYYSTSPYWKNLISFFNLAVTGLLLATYTSRFIFPLLSLEGQTIWVLGLCPLSRQEILWGKFAFACGGAILVTGSLTVLSVVMLRLEPLFIVLDLVTILILCFGVSGISVGLGARFPETRETDPSKIAAGFGGTLNLVTTLIFIVAVIGLMALPCHLYSVTLAIEHGAQELDMGEAAGISVDRFRWMLGASMGVSVLLGIAATYIPMKIGSRAFDRMEF